ncbi:HET-domain-containing protein [Colletotrichum falcatum]|nr:HET-domain-containing protein [Colletotrichum falcatum]
MTLSHRWGEAQFIQLRHNDEDTFRQGIPWDSLPQTFKDAIRVARHLGSDYLWIDSLCIVQDSSIDWVAEAASMGNIYKNALCNIAASDASNSLEGCLYPRSHRVLGAERLPWDPISSDHWNLMNAPPSEPHESSQLYSRAWVLQEFLLARRTVDCGRDQLFWRCDELMASEEIPQGYPMVRSSYAQYEYTHPAREVLKNQACNASLKLMVEKMKQWETRHREPLETPGFSGDGKSSYSHMYDSEGSPSILWTKLVDQYSSMSITKEEDRLAAVAGVADAFRPFLGEYYAGMWEYLLPPYLVWSTKPDLGSHWAQSRCKRPSPKRGPTWSWISLEGPIYHDFCDFGRSGALLTQFLDVKVLSAQDMHLRLRAPLIRLTWIDYVTRGMEALSLRSHKPGPAIWGSEKVLKWRSSWFESCDQTDNVWLTFDVAEEEEAARDIALVAIHIVHNTYVYGLIVQDKGSGIFTRVGQFCASNSCSQPFLKCDQTVVVLV